MTRAVHCPLAFDLSTEHRNDKGGCRELFSPLRRYDNNSDNYVVIEILEPASEHGIKLTKMLPCDLNCID